MSFVNLCLLTEFVQLCSGGLITLDTSRSVVLCITLSLVSILLFFIAKRSFGVLSCASPFIMNTSIFFFLSFGGVRVPGGEIVGCFTYSTFTVCLIRLRPLACACCVTLVGRTCTTLNNCKCVIFMIIFTIMFNLFYVVLSGIHVFA